MSPELTKRAIFILFFSVIFAWDVYAKYHAKPLDEYNETNYPIYDPYISGYILPTIMVLFFLTVCVFSGAEKAIVESLSQWFGTFVHIGIYYMILLPLLPFLRKRIIARACAVLWILPNYLYVQRSLMKVPMPLLVLRVPEKIVWTLFGIWLIGFLSILIWHIISHLSYRHQILQNSVAVTDSEILDIWNKEIEKSKLNKKKFRLVYCADVATPVSIGLFRSAIRVVLPERNYTPEELSLIFRHEIVHISREDSWSKFFLVFCTAMFWFNPLMWVSMRKCSEDLELSCDETVLIDCDDATRRRYANLILDTAGKERGFTTCLSASASAMRYRLQNIVKPKKKYSGAITVGLVCFLLTISNGYVSLAYGSHTGLELIYKSEDISNYHLSHITDMESPYQTTYICKDSEALYKYMAGLVMEEITGDYTYSGSEREMTFIYDTPDGTMGIILYDKVIKISPIYNKGAGTKYYYLSEKTNWDYLDALIETYPAANIKVNISDGTYSKEIATSLWNLKKIERGKTTVLYENMHPEEQPTGLFGYETSNAMLDFSHTLASEFKVKVETWDRGSSYMVSETQLETKNLLPLADYPAHYTIYATFYGDSGVVYEAEFRFDVGSKEG